MGPLVFLEFIIYKISMKPSLKKKEKMEYRMMRTKIKTNKENDDMWSTDDTDYK
jgi:hypothetical protein